RRRMRRQQIHRGIAPDWYRAAEIPIIAAFGVSAPPSLHPG
ncbi:hypothetical protein LTSEBAI_2984, partial [Salmonella enterica subsp. enterica serovar Baildon str. R6-199]